MPFYLCAVDASNRFLLLFSAIALLRLLSPKAFHHKHRLAFSQWSSIWLLHQSRFPDHCANLVVLGDHMHTAPCLIHSFSFPCLRSDERSIAYAKTKRKNFVRNVFLYFPSNMQYTTEKEKNMTPSQLIKFYGDDIRTAAALGKSQKCIQNWVKKSAIPYWSQLAIQAISCNKLKASKSHIAK